MKIFLSLTVGIILFTTFFISNPKETDSNKAIVIKGEITNATLKTSNGCGIGNFLIPVSGDSLQGTGVVLGALIDNSSTSSEFVSLNQIPGTEVKGVSFFRTSFSQNSLIEPGQPYVVITDLGMYAYDFSDDFSFMNFDISKTDSIPISGILKMANHLSTEFDNPIVLFTQDSLGEDSIRFYSYPFLEEAFSTPFYFEPEIFEATEDGLFITGLDTTGNYMLFHFSTTQNTLLGKYLLDNDLANGQEILVFDDSIKILSSPGDSLTLLSTLNLVDSTLTKSIIYSHSGARATHNDYMNNKAFTFQLVDDIPNEILDKQILLLDPLTDELDTLILDQGFDYFKYPVEQDQGFGFYPLGWIGFKDYVGMNDTLFLQRYTSVNKAEVPGFTQYVNATFGCWVSVHENELKDIKFEYYPNPASNQVKIHLSGLTKGKQYNLKIINNLSLIHISEPTRPY